MAINFLILSSVHLLIISMHLKANGVTIQLYKHQNFTGLLWESRTPVNCSNIPKIENANVFSIKTDTCFIAYHDPDCKSRWSMKYMPGNIALTEYDLGRDGRIRSFHTCNEEEGGNQLNVDITKYYTFSYLSSFVPDILQSYRNVCSCVNIPQCVQNMDIWSINNHHNDLLAYFEPNCSQDKWSSKPIAAGHSMDSRYMHDHLHTDSVTRTTYKIQSFGPNPNSSYYQFSCTSSDMTTENLKLISTETKENYVSTTQSSWDVDTDMEGRIRFLANEILEIKTKVDQLKRNQDKIENAMESVMKKRNDDFDSFTKTIEQYFNNFEITLAKLNFTCIDTCRN